MAFTRFTVTVTIDIEDQTFLNEYSELRADLLVSKLGTRVRGETGVKVQQVDVKITPNGMTSEEYYSKLHQQIHKDHEEDPNMGGGGSDAITH